MSVLNQDIPFVPMSGKPWHSLIEGLPQNQTKTRPVRELPLYRGGSVSRRIQGYLADKKIYPPRTLQ